VKVGDLVKVIQPGRAYHSCPFIGEVGVIIHEQLAMFKDQDSFSVMTRDRIVVLGADHLEVIHESR